MTLCDRSQHSDYLQASTRKSADSRTTTSVFPSCLMITNTGKSSVRRSRTTSLTKPSVSSPLTGTPGMYTLSCQSLRPHPLLSHLDGSKSGPSSRPALLLVPSTLPYPPQTGRRSQAPTIILGMATLSFAKFSHPTSTRRNRATLLRPTSVRSSPTRLGATSPHTSPSPTARGSSILGSSTSTLICGTSVY